MTKTLEDELKMDNWLSILTYDVVKYAAAGGSVRVEQVIGGTLVIILPNANLEKTHRKFKALLEPEAAPPAAFTVENVD